MRLTLAKARDEEEMKWQGIQGIQVERTVRKRDKDTNVRSKKVYAAGKHRRLLFWNTG